mgnify:CR=1 FL=1
MTESYTDYDLENSIRCIAAQLGIEGCGQGSGKTPKEIFSEIEVRCPAAAEALLERTFQKDQLKEYLARSPDLPHHDPQYDIYWEKLVAAYPLLISAIEKCKA